MVKEKDLKIATKISNELKQKLGDKLISVILYGSRAHGTAKKDSDMDLFVVVDRKPRFFSKTYDSISTTTDKYLFSHDLLVSPVVYGRKEYKNRFDYVFIREVNKGIKVYER